MQLMNIAIFIAKIFVYFILNQSSWKLYWFKYKTDNLP